MDTPRPSPRTNRTRRVPSPYRRCGPRWRRGARSRQRNFSAARGTPPPRARARCEARGAAQHSKARLLTTVVVMLCNGRNCHVTAGPRARLRTGGDDWDDDEFSTENKVRPNTTSASPPPLGPSLGALLRRMATDRLRFVRCAQTFPPPSARRRGTSSRTRSHGASRGGRGVRRGVLCTRPHSPSEPLAERAPTRRVQLVRKEGRDVSS